MHARSSELEPATCQLPSSCLVSSKEPGIATEGLWEAATLLSIDTDCRAAIDDYHVVVRGNCLV